MTIVGNQIVVSLDNILLATDFSPSAETARLYVQALSARYKLVRHPQAFMLFHMSDFHYSPARRRWRRQISVPWVHAFDHSDLLAAATNNDSGRDVADRGFSETR